MISCKMAMKIVALDPLKDVVVITELIEAGRVLANDVERLQGIVDKTRESIKSAYFEGVADGRDGQIHMGSAFGTDDDDQCLWNASLVQEAAERIVVDD